MANSFFELLKAGGKEQGKIPPPKSPLQKFLNKYVLVQVFPMDTFTASDEAPRGISQFWEPIYWHRQFAAIFMQNIQLVAVEPYFNG
jgi:hypothetical protein